ncbi:magnesium transporter [Mycoplasma sp. CSL10137]|uniref:magnesium transporter n=1 Tax=unclassified Mycoplasma TaxID=2683645 RepID=UPI00197C9F5C|nr:MULTISPECIES: magnesium transporter [unclassified Mycoplasma]MBN4083323.1 magnesium transporter [Mycoplasma sp. CSL10137]MBN4084374.1 magnesium transporter [Mycoplasma sp. CSL10166]MBU4692860.1 magnesium transporter [Mycoplasma sp. CSL7491-lung]
MENNNIEQLQNQILHEEIKNLISTKSVKLLRELEEETPHADFAKAVESLTSEQQIYVLRILRTEEAAEVFSYLDDEIQTNLVIQFSDDLGEKVLQEIETDELADIIEDLPVNITRKILSNTSKDKRDKINQLLSYSDDQIGSFMSVDFSILKSNWTAKKAISKIRADYNKNVLMGHNFYIVDQQGKLVGDITLEELVFSDENSLLDELYNAVASVKTTDDKEYAAQIFSNHDRSTLPVVSSDKRLIGMITSDDIIDIIQDEATEDIYKMAGIRDENVEDSYIKKSIKNIVRARVFWLIILMISATISQYIIQEFTSISESFFSSVVHVTISTGIITSLIPIISGAAGNAGSQSSTTVTRAASLGDFKNNEYGKVVWKETTIGLIIGLIMFLVNIVRLYIYYSIPFFRDPSLKWGELSFIIIASSFSLWIVVILAKFLGTVIPLLAIKLKKDPAVMSAPILTTLSDALATLIFFGLNILVMYIAYVAGLLGS